MSISSFQGIEEIEPGRFWLAVGETTADVKYRIQIMEYEQSAGPILDGLLEQPKGQDVYEYLEHSALDESETPYCTTYLYSVSEYRKLHDFTRIVLNRQVAAGQWEQIGLTPADLGIAD